MIDERLVQEWLDEIYSGVEGKQSKKLFVDAAANFVRTVLIP